MSQMGQFYFNAIESITGNAGGAVFPTMNNVNLVGAGGVTVTGNPALSTLTITAPGYANSFSTDLGANAVPTLGVINIAGGTNINTASPGVGNVVTVNLDDSISLVGSVTAGTTVTTTAGDITAGNVAVSNLAATFVLSKKRGAGVITTGDYLGAVSFQGHDGTAMHAGAAIISTSSGTIALNRIPANLSFWTHADAAGAIAERLTISSAGGVTIQVPTSGNSLTVSAFTAGALLSSAAGVISSSAGTNGQLLIGSTGAVPAWASVTSTGGTVTITGGAGTLNLEANLMAWSGEAGTPVALVANHGYINQNAGLTTFTLPAVAALGTVIEIVGQGAGGWTITQAAGQNIQFGNVSTTGGVGGSLSSSNQYDTVRLVCRVANTTWSVTSAVGNLTVV